MKRNTLIILLFTLSLACYATPSQGTDFPESYTNLAEAVQACNSTQASITALYNQAISAGTIYSDIDSLLYTAGCNYYRAMDYYYRKDKQNAIKYFELGINQAKTANDQRKTAAGLTLYAKLIMQNCALKDMGYQLKWVTKIPGICEEAMRLDSSYTPAFIMRYTYMCYIPAPYGSYREGPVKILALNDNAWKKTKEDLFNICCAAAYGYSHSGNKANAKTWYNKALEYYPNNVEVLNALGDLK